MRPLGTLVILAALVGLGALSSAHANTTKPLTASKLEENVRSVENHFTVSFKIRGALKGTRAVVKCTGGRAKGCPPQLRGKTKTITATKRSVLSLYAATKGAKLVKGAVFEVKWRDPGALFRRVFYRINSSRGYNASSRCEVAAGREAPCPF